MVFLFLFFFKQSGSVNQQKPNKQSCLGYVGTRPFACCFWLSAASVPSHPQAKPSLHLAAAGLPRADLRRPWRFVSYRLPRAPAPCCVSAGPRGQPPGLWCLWATSEFTGVLAGALKSIPHLSTSAPLSWAHDKPEQDLEERNTLVNFIIDYLGEK